MSAHRRNRRAELFLLLVAAACVTLSALGSRSNAGSLSNGLSAPLNSESTALYCVGFTGNHGVAPANVVFLNSSTQSRTVDIAISSGAGSYSRFSDVVSAHGSLNLAAARFVGTGFYAVSVQVHGGGVTAVIQGTSHASTSTPCVSQGATRWLFAGLSTHVPDAATISLLNPTAAAAVVNVSMIATTGIVSPQAFSVVVEPHAELALALGSQQVNTTNVTAIVRAVSGSVVAAAIESWSGPVAGSSVMPGTPKESASWIFPDVPTANGVTSVLSLSNLSSSVVVHVTVRVRVDGYVIEPFTEDVMPQSNTGLIISPSSRIPPAGAALVLVEASGPLAAGIVITVPHYGGPWLSAPSVPSTTQIIDDTKAIGVDAVVVVNQTSSPAIVQMATYDLSGPHTVKLIVPARGRQVWSGPQRASWRGHFVVVTSNQPVSVATTSSVSNLGAVVQNASGGR